MITVLGVGCREGEITLKGAEILKSDARIILHTGLCPAAEWLDFERIPYETLDALYEEYEDFDEHAEAAANAVREAAKERDVVYAVMDVRDESAYILANEGAKVVAGVASDALLCAYARAQVNAFAASDCENAYIDSGFATLVREIDTREMACDVKLKLMDAYPDDGIVFVEKENGVARVPLFMLDRLEKYDHRTSVLVNPAAKPIAFEMRDAVRAARKKRVYYENADYDSLLDAVSRVAGGAAYAEDHGEGTLREIISDACAGILR